jgi:hypothetical protein
LKPAYFSIYLHIKRKTPENRAYFISIFKIKGTMANVMKQPDVKYIKWQEGMRVTGKMTMPVNDYGEYLARSGRRHHNILRRKRLMKAS